jgi:SAM-dependent methyltransferase
MRLGYVLGVGEYDASRATYAITRQGDPRIGARIERALGDARTVVNVGAGAGSYESADRDVTPVEPSSTMRAQRPEGAAIAIHAYAEALPFEDASFDAATAILTVHHWTEPRRGLAELRRVARGPVVVLTFDPEQTEAFWLVRDYLPEVVALDRERIPTVEATAGWLGGDVEVEPVPIPHDCRDGFLGAYWRRPELYLEPATRPGMSAFSDLDPQPLERGLAKLRADLDSGAWQRRYGGLLSLDELDIGYRLVVSRPARPG